VDIGVHPPFPAGSKQLSNNFDNLLFLAVFRVELPEPFLGPKQRFLVYVTINKFCAIVVSPQIDLSNGLSYA
jgi:hypothetical protein